MNSPTVTPTKTPVKTPTRRREGNPYQPTPGVNPNPKG